MELYSKYLSTSKMSTLIDINAKWLREHRGEIFTEGVHYHFPYGFNDCRWNILAMIKWVENSNSFSNKADEVLKSLSA